MRKSKKFLSLLMAALLCVMLLPLTAFAAGEIGVQAGAAGVSNSPYTDGSVGLQYADIVYFGTYPQSEYTGDTTGFPGSPSTGEEYMSGGEKYRYQDGAWYKYEPIAWRVLKNDGTSLFILSDMGLDCQ
ncbi:MAG: hypothetical protein LBK69_05235, partial [Syntrophomonadaceae bacterium]|nr:hypothetical protein [Syntrophomonadaceae bacterium]